MKLSVEGIDRMYLNVYVPRLQTEQGVGVGRSTFSSLMLDEDFEGGEKRVADASESEQGQHHGYFGELRLRSEADSVGARRGCFVVQSSFLGPDVERWCAAMKSIRGPGGSRRRNDGCRRPDRASN